MRKIFALIGIILIGHPAFLLAQGDVLTLDQAIAEVLSGNQDIQAAHYRTEAAKDRIPQAKALEDPEVGVMFWDVPTDTADVTKGEINYQVQQKLPFPGKRYVRGKAARLDAEVTSENNRGRVLDVLLDLKNTYYDVYRIDRSLEVNRGNQGLLKQFLASTETAYAAGKTTADSPLKAQVELEKLKNEEILLDQERTTHVAHLKALLNRPSHDGEIRLPAQIKLPRLKETLEGIEGAAMEERPELKEVRSMEKRDQAKVTIAKQDLIPDFSLGFAYVQRPGQDAWTGTAMVNLPVFWGKKRAEIREAKASLKATQAEHQSMEIHTRHEIEQAYSAVKASEKIIASYRNGILPQAKATLESAKQAYTSNHVDFLTLIDAARTYKDMQVSYYENQAQLGKNFAELERVVGKSLGKELEE